MILVYPTEKRDASVTPRIATLGGAMKVLEIAGHLRTLIQNDAGFDCRRLEVRPGSIL